jgi:hypothetical protein
MSGRIAFALAWLAFAAATAFAAEEQAAIPVVWEAPEELRLLFGKHLPAPPAEGKEDRAAFRRWSREVRRRALGVGVLERRAAADELRRRVLAGRPERDAGLADASEHGERGGLGCHHGRRGRGRCGDSGRRIGKSRSCQKTKCHHCFENRNAATAAQSACGHTLITQTHKHPQIIKPASVKWALRVHVKRVEGSKNFAEIAGYFLYADIHRASYS